MVNKKIIIEFREVGRFVSVKIGWPGRVRTDNFKNLPKNENNCTIMFPII